jgi:hypothetical protein
MAPMNPVDAPAIDGSFLELLVDWAANAVVPFGIYALESVVGYRRKRSGEV